MFSSQYVASWQHSDKLNDMKSALTQLMIRDFKERKAKNSKYSLRSYARDLGIHPSLAYRYMHSERIPTIPSLKKLLDRMTADESLKLQILNAAIQGVSFKIPENSDYVEINPEDRGKINDWIYSAMMELFRSSRRQFQVPQIAKLFGITNPEVRDRIQTLQDIGLLKKTQKGFKTVSTRQSSAGMGSLVSGIHKGYLEQAIHSIERDRKREISGTTILISSKRLEEAKNRIRDFRRSLSAFLAIRPGETDETLVRIQIALFSLE